MVNLLVNLSNAFEIDAKFFRTPTNGLVSITDGIESANGDVTLARRKY